MIRPRRQRLGGRKRRLSGWQEREVANASSESSGSLSGSNKGRKRTASTGWRACQPGEKGTAVCGVWGDTDRCTRLAGQLRSLIESGEARDISDAECDKGNQGSQVGSEDERKSHVRLPFVLLTPREFKAARSGPATAAPTPREQPD